MFQRSFEGQNVTCCWSCAFHKFQHALGALVHEPAERAPSARRARRARWACRARGARRACVLVSHEKQTSPKASLNFKGSLQHPNLSLPPAFYTNPNARSARSSIQLKTKTWNITLQKESIAEMLWSSEHNIALHLFCLSTNPKKALSELGQNKP